MTDSRKKLIIRGLFPNIEKAYLNELLKLAHVKKIDWYDKRISERLHGLLVSIIRHRNTHYDECINTVRKDSARFFIDGEVKCLMKFFKAC